MTPPCVSVVIPTYRRPAMLARCLEALLAQDLPGEQFEIIVADDAGCEETCRQVKEVACRSAQADGPAVRYVTPCHAHGPAAARNCGWQAAGGEIIAFTDDDCVPDPGWLAAGLRAFDCEVAGASGRIVIPLRHRPTDYERNAAELEHARFATANCFYRRDALAEVGGFDERFEVAWREDADLMLTLLERGATLINAPAAVVVHPVRPARWGVSLWQQEKSMYNALIYKKHGPFYWRLVQNRPPWHYYGIAASALLALLGWATNRKRSSLVSGLVWFLLTGQFIGLRLRRTSHAPGHVLEMGVTSLLIPWLSIYWRLRGAVRYRVLFL